MSSNFSACKWRTLHQADSGVNGNLNAELQYWLKPPGSMALNMSEQKPLKVLLC